MLHPVSWYWRDIWTIYKDPVFIRDGVFTYCEDTAWNLDEFAEFFIKFVYELLGKDRRQNDEN